MIKFEASDLDNLGKLSFKFGGEQNQDFPFGLKTINDNSRWLTVNGSLLDFEQVQFWSFQVIVQDEPGPVFGYQNQDSVNVFIQVKDEPDNPPAWQSVPSVVTIIEEENEIGDKLFEIKAFDKDLNIGNTILYKLLEFKYEDSILENSFIEVNDNGEVLATMKIDREAYNQSNTFEVNFQTKY